MKYPTELRWEGSKLRRTARKAATRARLLEAARTLLAQPPHDIAQVTLAAIARTAGISVGAFYLHFTGVDALHAENLAADLAAGTAPLDAVRQYLSLPMQAVLLAHVRNAV